MNIKFILIYKSRLDDLLISAILSTIISAIISAIFSVILSAILSAILSVVVIRLKLRPNALRLRKCDENAWLGKKLTVSKVDGMPFVLIIEVAQAHDVALRLNCDLVPILGIRDKQAYLRHVLASPPAYVLCNETCIPEEVNTFAKSNRNGNPFNFVNPSQVAGKRLAEIEHRGLDIEKEFMDLRKIAIFKAVVNAIVSKLSG